MSEFRLETADKNAKRIMDGSSIVGWVLRLTNGTWGLYDADEQRVWHLNFVTPKTALRRFKEVAHHPAAQPEEKS